MRRLARISHRGSTATAQCRALTGFRSVESPDRVSAMPSRFSVAKAGYDTSLNHLATNNGEICGRACRFRGSVASPYPGRILALLLLLLGPLPAQSELRCGTFNPLAAQRMALEPRDLSPGEVYLSAKRAELVIDGINRLEGEVELQRGEQHLLAELAEYDADSGRVHARGNVRFFSPVADLAAKEARLSLDGDEARFSGLRFYLHEATGRGKADRGLIRPRGVSELDDIAYTSCVPGNEDWLLEAGELKLYHGLGFGAAKDASLWFMGVPLLYTPWLTFPISPERRSGFLVPQAGQSDDAGLDVSIPFYWNIAPNQDATFTPRVMSKRGTQLQGEYRLLAPRGDLQLYGEYLPSDRETDTDRALTSIRAQRRFGRGWRIHADATDVSDVRYFEDLGTNLSQVSNRFLERTGAVSYADRRWRMRLRAQDFQLVDRTLLGRPEPYQRLPQLELATRRPQRLLGGPLQWDLRTEWVSFASDELLEGDRFGIETGLGWRHQRSAYFIHPRVAYRYTAYSLEDDGGNPHTQAPVYSVDTGLFLERQIELAGSDLTQTLEPRLFYLYVPERDQADQPVFDTHLPELDFFRLFDDNRFTGGDRLADANRLTTAVTSRLISNDSGRGLVAFTVGQIHYFDQRDVTLPGEPEPPAQRSGLLAEVHARPHERFSGYLQVEWNPEKNRTDRQLAAVGYRPGADRLISLSYRHRRDLEPALKQIDLSALWPIGSQWSVLGQWSRSLEADRNLQTVLGVEYRSCCWSARLAGRRHISDVDGEDNTGIYFQLELRGLSPLGDSFEDLLDDATIGY